jgi:MFS superfamily sulfate permease-like transporter
LEPLHALTFADTTVTAHVGLIALVANVVIAVLVNFAMTLRKSASERTKVIRLRDEARPLRRVAHPNCASIIRI